VKSHLTFIFFLIFPISQIFSQVDTLLFQDGSLILGEVESLEKGVLTFDTEFDDKDFKIEWDEIKAIHTETILYITLKGGLHFYGVLHSKNDSTIEIISRDGETLEVKDENIVVLVPVKSGFKDRFEAEIDFGLGLAKSNNLKQLNNSNLIGYQTDKWKSHISFDIMISSQDSTETIKRSESEVVFQYIIYKDWYLVPSAKHLSNTEQDLKYRWNAQIGVGNFIVRTNKIYWGVVIGFNRNIEKYLNDDPKKSTWEAMISTTVDLFDIEDFDFLTDLYIYPGLTENKRWRVDWNLKVKYDLPLDFYIKTEFALNYDNLPVEGASDLDYVTAFGLGWEW